MSHLDMFQLSNSLVCPRGGWLLWRSITDFCENVSSPSLLSHPPPGVIRTQELLDHETTPHYWLTVYAMDRGVVPLSTFVEVYVEVQDVNDNAPQTSEPVYYPSVMENSPKDVSIIQINALDPDTKASDKLSYRITSGNPQGFFAINGRTGKTSASPES